MQAAGFKFRFLTGFFKNGTVCFLNAITWKMKIMYVYSLLTKKKRM